MTPWRTALRMAVVWAVAWSVGTTLWQLLKSLLLVGADVLASQFIQAMLYGLFLHAAFGAVAGAAFAALLHRFEPDRARVGLPLARVVLWGALAGWLVSPVYFAVVMLGGGIPLGHAVRTMVRFGATTAATGAIIALAQWRFAWGAVPGSDDAISPLTEPAALIEESSDAGASPGPRGDRIDTRREA